MDKVYSNYDWCNSCQKKKISIIIDGFPICNDCILIDAIKYMKIKDKMNAFLCAHFIEQETNYESFFNDVKKIIN